MYGTAESRTKIQVACKIRIRVSILANVSTMRKIYQSVTLNSRDPLA